MTTLVGPGVRLIYPYKVIVLMFMIQLSEQLGKLHLKPPSFYGCLDAFTLHLDSNIYPIDIPNLRHKHFFSCIAI